jgi:hypothetical protein
LGSILEIAQVWSFQILTYSPFRIAISFDTSMISIVEALALNAGNPSLIEDYGLLGCVTCWYWHVREPTAFVFRVVDAVKQRSTKLCGIRYQKIVTFPLAALRTLYFTACSVRIHCNFHSAFVTTSVLYTRVCTGALSPYVVQGTTN